MSPPQTVLLVGGGSGGHIYPNLAVAERLPAGVTPHLVISDRAVDRRIAEASGLAFTILPAAPLSVKPRVRLRFLREYRRGRSAMRRLVRDTQAGAVLATGGFVSGPAVAAAAAAGVPTALISLDAVPGKANRVAARKATAVFCAYPPAAGSRPLHRPNSHQGQTTQNQAEGNSPSEREGGTIGFPLRRAAVAEDAVTAGQARRHYGLDPDRPTLLVFAGSQGARTINRALVELASHATTRRMLEGWQLLHVTGGDGPDHAAAVSAYRTAELPAAVIVFCDRMDLAWRAAEAAVTRAGAGTVAEAWANAVPCVMLPYPFHMDQHQRHNAAPLLALPGGPGAVVADDQVDPPQNRAMLGEVLQPLLSDADRREAMRSALRATPPGDAAERLARWLVDHAGR